MTVLMNCDTQYRLSKVPSQVIVEVWDLQRFSCSQLLRLTDRAANDLTRWQYEPSFQGESWTTAQSSPIPNLKFPLNDPGHPRAGLS